ncbi:MAG: helix-hairpin-helix domain-containing protein [Chitinophagaceae bacterium]|nr:helix-hairpin-helix domain-containing protein [Chitinophagaceae bacterium]
MKRGISENNTLSKSYLSFSRSQKRAVVVFGCVASGIVIVFKSGIFESSHTSTEPFVAVQVEETLKIKEEDSGRLFEEKNKEYKSNQRSNYYAKSTDGSKEISFTSGALSTFDPNTVTYEELISFGLREKAALNILNFREKGGRFQKPEDLKKMYSLTPEEAAKLIPYAKIFTDNVGTPTIGEFSPPVKKSNEVASADNTPRPNVSLKIDVNKADSLTWTLLPGIGGKRASAILKYRGKLGGFANIDQVGETFGLPDSIFQQIKPNLIWNEESMEKISINECSEAQLKSHPYITWQLAKVIVAYRNQHGPYKKIDDLLKIHSVEKGWLEKIRPYLNVDTNSLASGN